MYLPFAAAPPSARTISRQTIYFFSLKAHMPPDLQKKKKPPLPITAHTTLVSPCGPHFPRLRAGRSIAPQLFLHPPLDLEDMAGSPTSGRHYPGSRATAILSPSHRRCPPQGVSQAPSPHTQPHVRTGGSPPLGPSRAGASHLAGSCTAGCSPGVWRPGRGPPLQSGGVPPRSTSRGRSAAARWPQPAC